MEEKLPNPNPEEKAASAKKPGRPASRKQQADEGAPKTETPEGRKEVPEETARDDEAVLETPEAPAPPPVVHARLSGDEPVLAEELAVVQQEDPTIADLYRHVAQSPVDAHAPVWLGRAPNSP